MIDYDLFLNEGVAEIAIEKIFTGTFLQLDPGLTCWNAALWNKEFSDMSKLGLRTIIVQYVGGGKNSYYPSRLDWFSHKYNLLDTIMEVAKQYGFEVFLGLYLSDGWWLGSGIKKFLDEELVRNKKVVEELNQLYGKNPAFYGWYIPHELEGLQSFSWCRRNRLTRFFEQIVNVCKTVASNKPVAIAPYFGANANPSKYAQLWDSFFKKVSFDFIMLQDGVGCQRVSPKQARLFFQEMLIVCNKNNLELWGDLEVFEQEHGYPVDGLAFDAKPAKIERIKKQIDSIAPFVKKLVCFEYNHYLSLCRGERERTFYQEYANYVSNICNNMLK